LDDFGELYEKYFDDVYRYALSLCRSGSEAEEITQETFFRALQSVGKFRGECGVYVWMCQIAKNTYFSLAKKKKRFVSDGEVPERAGGSEPESDYIAGESGLELQSALQRLEEPYREVLMLRFYGELPFARIGQLFGKTESWARVTCHRGRLKLKEML
jgi:RNA polymerase sigma-70 factor, ECF subfamily